jgi:L-lactate dehydrogenase (cytochrome)
VEQFDPELNWGDVEWIKKRWGGKLILKGIMDAEDARWPWTAAPTRSSSATTAAASSTARPRPSPRCPASQAVGKDIEAGWTAASAAARTCSRPAPWARAAR